MHEITGDEVRFGPFQLHLGRRELRRDGAPVRLGDRALDILCELVAARGQLVTKADLLARVWAGTIVEENAIQVHMSALRKVLDEGSRGRSRVTTVAGRGYRFVGEADEQPVDLMLHDKPTIAVLPFSNLSGDRDQEYFADGVSEDIITNLSRARWLLVIARNSSFAFKGKALDARQISRELGVRYVLEGSVRRAGDRMRIGVHLVDAADGAELWAERYEARLSDVFTLQDEITQCVAGAIEPELLRTEGLRASQRRSEQLGAWELVRQGTWQFHQITRPTHRLARELFRKAVAADAQLPEAHMWLGRVNESIVGYGWSEDAASDLREAVQSSLRGVRLDERDPFGHYALAMSYLFSGALDQAVPCAERAAELSPSFALAHLGVGMSRLYAGDAAHAVLPLERGLRLNPFDPQNFHWHRCLALAHHFSGAPEQALAAAIRATQVAPQWRPAWEAMIVCLLATGRTDEARRHAERMRALDVPPSDVLDQLRFGNPAWATQMAEAICAVT
ncbi:winged helix-turn-helix domain-containing tetratricopeptide repeat protein [Variovorax soli]|uniref:TolB-like protein/Tfp pilus assembly protein PilF n=1 Tax=Variovorax soli TaxID=376815 RepID=A0ABU1NL83_9BURK|nr:winged helix-turn-helix domain-containing tetratricopeptide repeat protein [Variovorax soli]MDR6539187.1 TolB-like protein/Tfp pilus assembly protein PilF [Variovorax soli]